MSKKEKLLEFFEFVDGRFTNGRFSVSHRISNAPYGLDNFHGHTYEISVAFSGSRGKFGFIFPFEEVSEIIRKISEELNNKTLLATGGKNVIKDEGSRVYYLTADNKQYTFPKDDVFLIPVEEVTAENLAEWIADRVIEEMRTYHDFFPNVKGLELTLYEGRNRGIKLRIPVACQNLLQR